MESLFTSGCVKGPAGEDLGAVGEMCPEHHSLPQLSTHLLSHWLG